MQTDLAKNAKLITQKLMQLALYTSFDLLVRDIALLAKTVFVQIDQQSVLISKLHK